MKQRRKKKRIKRNENNLRDIWDNVKCPNIRIIGVPEEEEKKKGYEKIFEEMMVGKFPQHGKGNNQVQEVHRVLYRIKPRRNMPKHILIKLTKAKHKEY